MRCFNHLVVAVLLAINLSCTKDMAVQAKFTPEGATTFYADGRQNRVAPEGTVALDDPDPRAPLETGEGVKAMPLKVTRAFLKLGQSRYNIYCTPCHDRAGTGDGTVVHRGFQKPESLLADSVQDKSDGALFATISRGHGAMAGYQSMMTRDQRWAVVAYLRALKLSADFPAADLDGDDVAQISRVPRGGP